MAAVEKSDRHLAGGPILSGNLRVESLGVSGERQSFFVEGSCGKYLGGKRL
jgi:hypothetical protein